jgi:alpha-tubulin suppressor-like RCC1 family protein
MGQVMYWGFGGLLGSNGTEVLSRVPVRVQNIERALERNAGSEHSCGRELSGQLKCWGSNRFGQFGNGTVSRTYALVPVLVNINLSIFD